jgi:hypothetical protein
MQVLLAERDSEVKLRGDARQVLVERETAIEQVCVSVSHTVFFLP